MNNVDFYIDTITKSIDAWHADNLKIFDYDNENDDLENLLTRLSYHNYVAWHLIEEYQNDDAGVVKFVYDGGLYHNPRRNLCMQKIDEIYVNLQTPTENFNSEGMGSIFDKLSNDYIKLLHLIENEDERQSLLVEQVNFYKKCLNKLHTEILNGTTNIIIFQKFKINGY